MIAENNTDKTSFSYVWRCDNANPKADQSIPMRTGDYLFICVMDDGTATFRYRSCDWRDSSPCSQALENEAEWAGATARFDGKVLTGNLKSQDRKFEITITPKEKGNGFDMSCKHFVNPPEGDWDGSDDWGSGQQG